MHRLFLAVRPPAAIRDAALDLMDDGLPVRWQEEDQLHLTLRFIGEVERPMAEDLAAALAAFRFAAFEIALAGVGRFARRRGGALWAGVAPKEPLAALAARLDRLCQGVGLTPEHRAYHPHLTLARWSGAEPPAVVAWLERHAAFASSSWTADRVTLFESHLTRAGARYETVLEVGAD
ncbi:MULTISPECIES: RNA 2',3'-cyclic phosphodiesterase [Sphingomonas]|uniref:RNA 2',3'-cyclic phosphodiesterase n=1 Tax=Sphingomonas TaxID=13687 RepID=UPI000DEFD49D|nr:MULTISPECIES: RNA 2',3'-cyclic phosphodiesterase [Sphingomonas]